LARFLVRRLLWGVVLLVLVSAATFLIFYKLPSTDAALLRAGRGASPQTIAAIRHNLGLDRPITVQFWDYLKALVLHFDLGFSYQSGQSVRSLIADRLPATVSVVLGAAVLWLAIGIPLGILSALRPRSLFDRIAMGGALVFLSTPVFWLGLVVLYLFADDIGKWPILPGANSYVGLTENPGKWFTSLLLPWLTLAAGFAAIYARVLRTSLVETMHEDYIRTARAKGISERRVVLRHGLRTAITPLVTLLGLDIGVLLGGAILVESVFDIPGIGRLNYDAIVKGNLPVIQGTVLLAALFVVVANIVVDIAYALIDPRVRVNA